MSEELKLTPEEMEKIGESVLELRETGKGFNIKYTEEGLISITREGKPYILSEQELIVLKVFMDTINSTMNTIYDKTKK